MDYSTGGILESSNRGIVNGSGVGFFGYCRDNSEVKIKVQFLEFKQ